MQEEIDAASPAHEARILGVNQIGQEGANALACEGRTLPWLQEAPGHMCWDLWHVTWRDVVILDGENRRVAVYNLTTHDLAVPANYDSLKSLILQTAND